MNKRKKVSIFFITILLIFIIVGLYQIYKPLPKGLSFEGEIFSVPDQSVRFIADLTFINSNEEYISEQVIFDEVFQMIDRAENFILLDMFLYNDFLGKDSSAHQNISRELSQKLVNKKSEKPELQILVVTDRINTIYGGIESPNLNLLRSADVQVVETNLRKLRDSNPIYSSMWRTFFRFLPVSAIKLTNPFVDDGQKVGLNFYFELVNFKANHRKVIIADYINDDGDLKVSSLVTSANPHDGSSRHSNVAIMIDDFIWQDILKSELAVVNFSGGADFNTDLDMYENEKGPVNVQLLTEKKIKDSLLRSINEAVEGDEIKMLMFYISDRKIVKALKAAHRRGVDVKVVLDPNKDAFGREKNGVPNVSVAREFKKMDPNFQIKWCDTNGEQCHSKMTIIEKQNGHELFIGSANLTRRNLDDYNLETNIKIWGESVSAVNDPINLFNNIWNNDPHSFSTDYETYKDESFLKHIQYIIMEKTGLSTF